MAVRSRKWITRKGEQKEAWVADYTDGTGKRHIRTFARKKEADAYAAKVRVDVNAGMHVALDGDLTVLGAADKWINDVKANGAEESTIRMYRLHVKAHIAPRVGSLKLAKLTQGHVAHLRDGLLRGERKLSLATAHKVWVSFKSMLKANNVAHLASNISIKKGQRSRPLESGTDIPTPDEVKRIIAAAGDNMKLATFLRTAALTDCVHQSCSGCGGATSISNAMRSMCAGVRIAIGLSVRRSRIAADAQSRLALIWRMH
jgi:integrase